MKNRLYNFQFQWIQRHLVNGWRRKEGKDLNQKYEHFETEKNDVGNKILELTLTWNGLVLELIDQHISVVFHGNICTEPKMSCDK